MILEMRNSSSKKKKIRDLRMGMSCKLNMSSRVDMGTGHDDCAIPFVETHSRNTFQFRCFIVLPRFDG